MFTRGGNIDLKYLKMFPELPETATELKKFLQNLMIIQNYILEMNLTKIL